jgi:feruloyl-CoA synthase
MFASPSVELEQRGDGSFVLRSRETLRAYPASIGVLLDRWSTERPDRIFLSEPSRDGAARTLTYAETRAAVRSVASALLELGLTRDTPLGILSGPSLSHAIVSLAAQYVGIPVAPISPAYSTQFGDLRRLTSVIGALKPKLVFTADGDAYQAALAALDPAIAVVVERGAVPRPGTHRLADLRAHTGAGVDAAQRAVTPDHIAKILFTSGSTGEPKGVINTHRMLCSNQQSLAQAWPFLFEQDVVIVDWLPWHHTFGGNHNFNLVLFHGGTLHIDDGRPVAGHFDRSIAALREHPPTLYFNVPRGHKLLADALDADPAFAERFFSRLRVIGNAAAALPVSTYQQMRAAGARYGASDIAFTGSWGLTETAPMVTVVHYPLENPADVGLPGPGSELLFVTHEHKREVRVRGPGVTPGYWGRDDLTARAFDAEGFYRTGDAMRLADPSDPHRGLLFDGRIAENFKLTTGTWVDAGAVRLAVLSALNALVDDVVVGGENGDEIGVLLFTGARARATFSDDNERRAVIASALRSYNAGAGGSSFQVGRALLVDEPLSPADGELTDKGSVNQRRVLERRAAAVQRLFAPDPGPDVVVVQPVRA